MNCERAISISVSFGGGEDFVHYLIFNEAMTDRASLKIRRWTKSKKKITPVSFYNIVRAIQSWINAKLTTVPLPVNITHLTFPARLRSNLCLYVLW